MESFIQILNLKIQERQSICISETVSSLHNSSNSYFSRIKALVTDPFYFTIVVIVLVFVGIWWPELVQIRCR
ncbi:hypothetical protein GMMP15_850025 [Candidatus Magnetomoraceae bacterium gMMP-15]